MHLPTYSTLISAQDLFTHISDERWVILDCRHDLMDTNAGSQAYAAGHIPQAQFVHLDQSLSAPKVSVDGVFRGRHPLPDKQQFIQTLRRLGISNDTQVIAYDAHGGMFAARLWWMLRWVGHAAVAVLDGGIPAWNALSLPLTTDVPLARSGAMTEQTSLVAQVDVAAVFANITSAEFILVDARAADRYRGENETIDPVGGHIPGALNRFFKDNLQADGHFKTADQLHAEWSALLTRPEKAIMQCGSGVTACHNLLALEVAGLKGASLYPGSWSEWCSDSSRPVAR
ncbi:sulfurtransferase [Undibacterium jejuense]|uniref:Sulfurtransferase n=1 Tax=Undibacterium jejuense TaxID=1344949 RepID=A0A923KJU7_9BURK|nr:sulfurtransferase [Undibacterium jejuense]MBC3861090.1 sulfurtransferase [Undibacterium jejuense]